MDGRTASAARRWRDVGRRLRDGGSGTPGNADRESFVCVVAVLASLVLLPVVLTAVPGLAGARRLACVGGAAGLTASPGGSTVAGAAGDGGCVVGDFGTET
ncbi:hypothetical protein ABZ920_00355 [Streptomyces sp. NPDC046831]|uniref:hypothetical protein n=1 Tax=Streptomyces sp. NPDC046831 TaxID=3154805 RepID=UPI0033D31CDA